MTQVYADGFRHKKYTVRFISFRAMIRFCFSAPLQCESNNQDVIIGKKMNVIHEQLMPYFC